VRAAPRGDQTGGGTAGPTMRRFDGRVAIVTGAASGLGRAIAQRLAAEGASVVLADIDAGGATAVASALPSALAVRVDVADEASVDRGFDEAIAAFGTVDVVVNNAGVVGPQLPLHQTDEDSWRHVLAVNADGAFHVLRRGLATLLQTGGGAVVNMASSTGLAGKPNLSPYTFSKAGLIGLTRSAAIEYAEHGIRVNAVAPTTVLTELVRGFIDGSDDPASLRARIESQTPIPGLPLPEDVAAAVAFLASDDARWITGHTLPVDGGYHAR
jgi:NAD(P)-dependent dehydrogenase (short-subunit alcohol dehydrogenase family)